MGGPITRRFGADPWKNLEGIAGRGLAGLLRSRWVRDRGHLSSRQLQFLAQGLQDLVAPRVLSPLLQVGAPAWQALAVHLESPRMGFRAIAAKWASREFPVGLQCHLWTQYVPYCDGAGPRLRKAIAKRRGEGKAPKAFEKRVVFRIVRAGTGWRVIGAGLEPVDVGEELVFRIEVVKHNGAE